MADLAITAANVKASANSTTNSGIAGEAITAGQPVYSDASDEKKLKLADSNDLDLTNVIGIALNDAAADQPVNYVRKDPSLTIGATVAIGEVYVLSSTAGGVAPVADLSAGQEAVIMGVGISTTQIAVDFSGNDLPLRSKALIVA